MLKFRSIPETNSSSSHSLIMLPGISGTPIVPPNEIPSYTYDYIRNLISDDAAEIYKKLARKKGWKINEKYDSRADFDTAVTIETFGMSWEERSEAIAYLYINVVETVIKNNLFVETQFDEQISGSVYPWFGPVFHNGYIGIYKNGNYYIAFMISNNDNNIVFARFKYNKSGNKFIPAIPESLDLKITNKCYAMCPFCHENSTPDGEHASDEAIEKFLETLEETPIPEIAVGGGNPLLFPDLEKLLKKLGMYSIVGITARDIDYVEYGVPNYAQGYGISLTSIKALAYLFNEGIITSDYPVIHVINGVHTTKMVSEALDVYEAAVDGEIIPAVLILGFKQYGRGRNWKVRNTIDVEALRKKHPDVIISFDDLAIEQLGVKRLIPDEQWDILYNGRDTQYTMYIDLVKREYAKNSYSDERYKITEWNFAKMFQRVRG